MKNKRSATVPQVDRAGRTVQKSMSDWSVGQRLKNGRYEVEACIGIGGFGATYRARDLRSDMEVAIKTLNSATQNHPDFDRLQESFVNEAISLASCRHPQIVRVYPQLFQEGPLWCMVMEYVAGESLGDRCKRLGPMPPERAVAIITKVGEALEFVHQQGFLHRDVKPQNILLRREDDAPVLIDFGLAREYRPGQLDELTNHFTDCFAPIEQYVRLGHHGTWTDVYALAATLYVALTSELPVPSRFRRQGAPLVPPAKHNPVISDRLERAILLGMALDAAERPQTVAQWLTYLRPDTELPDLPPSAANLAGSYVSYGNDDRTAAPSTGRQTVDRSATAPSRTHPQFGPSPERGTRPQPITIPQGVLTAPSLGTASQVTEIEPATFDYGTLRRQLEAGDWAAANAETYHLMLCLMGRLQQGWLRAEDLEEFPCADLQAIAELWEVYSDGHFGFKVQRQLFLGLSRDRYNLDAWKSLGVRLGWRAREGDWYEENQLAFDRQAPRGHLPGWLLRDEYRSGGLAIFSALFWRLGYCGARLG